MLLPSLSLRQSAKLTHNTFQQIDRFFQIRNRFLAAFYRVREIVIIHDGVVTNQAKVKSLVDAAAVKKDLAVNKAIDFVKSKANIVAGAAEEKKPAKKTTRKTTKKAAAKQDEEPKEEETKGE